MSELKPLHTINVFIEPWFREEIIKAIILDLSVHPDEIRKELVETIKVEVKVSGFRNPLTVPKRLLVRESDKLFETDPMFVGLILRIWMSLFKKHDNIFNTALKELNFEISNQAPNYSDPMNALNVGWPKDINYQKVIDTVRKEDEKLEMSDDQIVLYTILKTGYLPGEIED